MRTRSGGRARDRLLGVLPAAHEQRDRRRHADARPDAARVVVRDARGRDRVVREAVEVLHVEQADRRAAHHASVACRLAARVFPGDGARLRRRLAGPQVLQRRSRQIADIFRFSGKPFEQALGDVVDVEPLARDDRPQEHEREVDVVGRLAGRPSVAAGDLARRADVGSSLALVWRAERFAGRRPEQGADEAAPFVDLRLGDGVGVLLEQIRIRPERAHVVPSPAINVADLAA